MSLDEEALEISLMSAFVGNLDMSPADIDMARMSHEGAIQLLAEFLSSLEKILPTLVQAIETHGISEDGVDILLRSMPGGLTIGWQLKSHYDLTQPDFQRSVLAQILRSKKYDLDRFIVVLCTDPLEHSKKIKALVTEVAQTSSDYVRVVLPEDFLRILRKENWIALRGRVVSRLMGAPEVPEKVNQSIVGADPMSPRFDTSTPLQLSAQAQDSYNAGLRYVAERNFALAEECFETALKIERSPTVFNALAATQLMRGDFTSAMTNLREGLKESPATLSLLYNLAVAYLRLGLTDESLQYARDCQKAEPNNPLVLKLLLKILVRLGRSKEALEEAARVMDMQHMIEAELNLTLANAALNTEQTSLAERFYTEFSNRMPKDYRGYWGLAICERRSGNYAQAAQLCRRALELEPKASVLYFELANNLRDSCNTDEALLAFKKANELSPKSVPIIGNYANLLRDLGRLREAIEVYDILGLQSPADPLVWENRGQCLRRLGKHDESIESYRAALAIVREPGSVLLNSAGLALIEANKLSEAKHLLELSVSRDPTNWMPHSNLATIFCMIADFGKEVEELKKSIELGGRSDRELTRLASSYVRLGQLDKAYENVRLAIKTNPNFAPALGTEGLILLKQGNRAKGIGQLRRARELDPSLAFVNYWLDHSDDSL